MSTFGDNVRYYRIKHNMTQEELALRIGYKGRSSINKIETNVAQVPQKTIQDLADALCVPVASLFSEAEPKSNGAISPRTMEYVPYLEKAQEWQLEAVRKILDMPVKKICRSSKEIV